MVRNFCTKSFHEVMESDGWLTNQCLALFLGDNRNNHSLRASFVTTLYLVVSHTSMKFVRCLFGFTFQLVKLDVLKYLTCHYFQLEIVILNGRSLYSRLKNRRW